MTNLSVAEAAQQLGVSVPRIHQRISDGSLRAQRIGSQWVVDELALLRVAERSAGRPLSARSAWALIALEVGDADALAVLVPVERARARARLATLFDLAEDSRSEEGVRAIAVALRSWFRNRASRELCKAAHADLPGLRLDSRWIPFGLSAPGSGIGAGDLAEGYVAPADHASLSRDFLLVPAEQDANLVLHVLPVGGRVFPDSQLLLAADLAEHRGPREELRAAELLREVAASYDRGEK